MNFAVDSADIDSFAKLIRRASEDMQSGSEFLRKHAEVSDAVGDLWQTVYGSHSQHVADATKCLRGFKRILDASAAELAKSANYYEATDEEEAQKLDSMHPQSKINRKGDTAGPNSGSTGFADREDATEKLRPSSDANGYGEEFIAEMKEMPVEKLVGTALDFASPSAVVLEFINAMTGLDPVGDFVKWLDGDWESYLKCAEIWGSLANLSEAVSLNLRSGNAEIDRVWKGNAADAAYTYFDELSEKLQILKGTFISLRENYEHIAKTVYVFANFMKGFLMDVLDLGLKAFLNWMAGNAAATTGAGAAVAIPFWAMAAKQIVDVMDRYSDAVDMLGKAAAVANVVTGTLRGTLAATSATVNSFPVPGAGYDNAARVI